MNTNKSAFHSRPFAASLFLATFAAAQQQPQQQPQQPQRQIAEQPAANLGAPPPNLADLMRANNGSLYRAAVAMPGDPRIVTAQQVNPFAVPAPVPKTLAKHDLVTIVVREESEFTSEGTTDTKKGGGIDARVEAFPKFNLADFALKSAVGDYQPRIAFEGDRNYKGEATVDRKDSLTTRVQAEVVDVKPNGTLVLQARKRIVTDEEAQLFVLTGVCRVQDITIDNTVLSTQMYDLDVRKTHSGAVRDGTKRGFVPRALDWINPF
ncbi:MAG TPA: flagellar basal body L-ring protein FlgH [Tepidisphaeraceae bacterium]|jgi:flagellar L-ring protein precursor FlgH